MAYVESDCDMTPEQSNALIQLLGSAPTQGILWFLVFWGTRSAVVIAKERIAWLQSRLDKYMDRDMEIVKGAVIQPSVPVASKYQDLKGQQ